MKKQKRGIGKIFSSLLPVMLLLSGLYFVPIKIFETDFSKIPGDFGDARFNNYILEHGHKYLTDKVDKYWDAPFMYPCTNVVAFSDNLLGTVPVYTFFRLLGKDRESAFQFWILSLFALNFICCFWALKKWSNHVILSSVGAYIYAFGIYNIGQLDHMQVFPRFIIPLVFYWCWKYLSQKKLKHFLLTSMGIVYQFYCGIYLGFFLIYSLLFFFIAHIIIYRDWSLFSQLKKIKTGYLLMVILIAVIFLAPLMIPYIEVSHAFGMRKFEEVISTVPKLRSYFFTHIAASTWRNVLSAHSQFAFPDWWSHFLFTGALPWLGILTIPAMMFSKKTEPAKKKFAAFVFLGFLLNIIFCLNIKGFTLYKFIFELPGFSSMRSIDRIINVEIIFFILVFVFVFKELSANSQWVKWLVMCFPVFVVIDNRMDNWVKRYDKLESQLKVNTITEKIKEQYDSRFHAIAYMPVTKINLQEPNAHDRIIETHLSVMLAAQELNIPCVNAYSGNYPGNYMSFFDNMDDKTLNDWCAYNKTTSAQIQIINDIGKKVKGINKVLLMAGNGKFVCADESLNNAVVANKDKANSWEIFSLIMLNAGNCVLCANNGLFFSAELNNRSEITATRTKIDAWETFTLVELDSNMVAFKAGNDKYLSVDEKTLQLFAIADSVGKNEKFLMTKEE